MNQDSLLVKLFEALEVHDSDSMSKKRSINDEQEKEQEGTERKEPISEPSSLPVSTHWVSRTACPEYPYRLVCPMMLEIIYKNIHPFYSAPARDSSHRVLSSEKMLLLADNLLKYGRLNCFSGDYNEGAILYVGSGIGTLQLFMTLYFDCPRNVGLYKDFDKYCAAMKAHSNLHNVVRFSLRLIILHNNSLI